LEANVDLVSAEKTKATRLYDWAKRAMVRELDSGFPMLDRAKNGIAAAAAALLRQMPDDERAVTCTGLVKTRHRAATRLLGEAIDETERHAALNFVLNTVEGDGVAIAARYEEDRGLPPGGLVSWERWGRFQPAWYHRPRPSGDTTPGANDPFTRWMIDLLEGPESDEAAGVGCYTIPAQVDPLARSILDELKGAGYPSDATPRALDPLAESILDELESAGYTDEMDRSEADSHARSILDELKAVENGRPITLEELEQVARPYLDAHMLQPGAAPAEPLLDGVGWEYRMRFGDWDAATRVIIHGTSGATMGYAHRIGRRDRGSGTQELDLGECNPLNFLGFYCEYWTVYTEEQVIEALRLICEVWDFFFSEIPPLLMDLTID